MLQRGIHKDIRFLKIALLFNIKIKERWQIKN